MCRMLDLNAHQLSLHWAWIVHESSQERVALVRESATGFANELLAKISQTGMDLKESKTIFIGGGSALLKSNIEMTEVVSKPLFIENVFANVEGYKILHENKKAGLK